MKVSILIPVKDQSELVTENIESKVIPFFGSQKIDYEILICSDHSSSKEQWLLEQNAKKLGKKTILLPYEDRKGKGAAVKKMIEVASGDYCLIIDADLSTDLGVFATMVPDLGKIDAFFGTRDDSRSVVSKQSLIRRITHWGARKKIKAMFPAMKVDDTQCGFKLIRTSIVKKAAEHQIIDGFAFDVEYCYFVSVNGYSIVNVPIKWENNEKASSVSPLKASLDFAKDLKRIKANERAYKIETEKRPSLS
jgi:glycosyltransferase involved in cell wall biosynthesis